MKRIPLATLLGVLCFVVLSIFTQHPAAANRPSQQNQTPTQQSNKTILNDNGTITTVSDETAEGEFVPGEMLVKFRNENDAVDAGRGMKDARGHLKTTNPRLNEIFARFDVNDGRRLFAHAGVKALSRVVKLKTQAANLKEALAALREQPDVEYAELNMIVHTQTAPNDAYYSTSGAWGQTYRDLWGLQSISAETAWNTTQGDGVIVAVIDTGLDYNHEDIAGNVWSNDGEVGLDGNSNDKRSNGVDDDGNGLIDDWHGWDFVTIDGTPGDNNPMDDHGHGTHVSGTIAALGNNGLGVIGVAPHAKVMPVKGLDANGSGSIEDLSNAIIYAADKGAQVINNSWGGGSGPTPQTLIDAVSYAHNVKGAVVVAAAGNSNFDVGTQSIGFYPACIRDVIAVAAINHLDAKASFSNFGAKIDVTAPGGGDTDSTGLVIQPDRSILSLLSSQAGSVMTGSGQLVVGTKYLRQAGTSMASPHVAGVAALIRAQHPEFSPEQVRQALRSSADDIGTAGFDTQFGYGRLNASRSLTIAAPLVAQLTSPVGTLNGLSQVNVTGSVVGANLSSWRLEYGAGTAPSSWTVIKTSSAPINSGTLATWNLTGVNDGTYTLHLVAQALTGEIYQDRLTVVLDGLVITDPDPSPFSLRLTRGEQGVTIRGTVASANFARYTIQIVGLRVSTVILNSAITVTNGGLQPVHDGVLGTWNTTGAPPDTYQITVTETFTNNNWVLKTTKIAVDSTLRPGWPVDLGLRRNGIVSYGLINHVDAADIDGNGTKEIIIGYDQQVRVIDHTGAQLPGWPQNIDPDNIGALIQISPAVADLDGDGSPEIVAANDHSKLFIWSANGTLWPGWPKTFPGISTSIAIDDLNGDGQKEIILTPSSGVRVIDKNGVVFPGFPVFIGPNNTAPAIGDVDGDGQKEIVVATGLAPTNLYMIKANGVVMPGWPRAINPQLSNSTTWSYPVLGDLDGDGKMECVIGSADGFVYAFRADGSYFPGWPQATQPVRVNSPAIGDIDGDGVPEVVAGNDKTLEFGEYKNYLYAWHADGTLLPNWPVKYDRPISASFFGFGAPALADLDQDGRADIIVSSDTTGGSCSALNAYKSDGSKVPDFPKPTLFTGAFSTNTAAVADLDGNGFMEMAWIDGNGLLYVWDLSAPSTAVAPWPMYQHDERHTGVSLRTAETIPPTVTITSPAAGSHLAGTVNVTTQATDNAGVVSIELYKDNVLVGSSAQNALTFEWNTAAEADGPHTFVSKAYDINGNVGTSSPVVLDADNTPPAASVTAPANGAVVTGGSVTISANATDSSGIQKIDFYADGVLAGTDTSAPFTANWNTINVPDGPHSLYVVATDTPGNSTPSPSISVTVDHLGPTVALTNPVNAAVITGVVNLAVNVFDGEGVQKVQYYRDSSVLLGTSLSAPFGLSWDSTAVTQGSHTLFAVATDLAGNTATSAGISVIIDRSAPTVSMTAPSNNAVVTGTAVTISATASDNNGVSRVDFYRDSNVLLGTDITSPYSISWNTTPVASGAHTLTAVVTDLAGNTKTSSVVNVSVDNAAPSVSLSTPANNAFVTGTFAVSAAATDNVAISKVEFYLDNVLLTTDTSSPYTFNWNSTTVTQGAHTWYAIAQDGAGFRTTSSTTAITVDNTAPTVAITSPANGAAILPNAVVNINANASDNFGVVKVEFYVGTTLTCTITTAPYTCVWQVPNQRANFNLKATAYDVAGKTATHTISVSSR